MLLFILASNGVLVAEDEVDFGTRAGKVGTEHDNPGRLVVELLARGLEAILKELDVTATAVATLLVLDLVLNDERLSREADRRGERCGDSVMGGLGLGNKTLIALNNSRVGILDRPLADVREGLATDRSLLGGLRDRPAPLPVVSELLEEGSFD
jgi:hypothetical protein